MFFFCMENLLTSAFDERPYFLVLRKEPRSTPRENKTNGSHREEGNQAKPSPSWRRDETRRAPQGGRGTTRSNPCETPILKILFVRVCCSPGVHDTLIIMEIFILLIQATLKIMELRLVM